MESLTCVVRNFDKMLVKTLGNILTIQNEIEPRENKDKPCYFLFQRVSFSLFIDMDQFIFLLL